MPTSRFVPCGLRKERLQPPPALRWFACPVAGFQELSVWGRACEPRYVPVTMTNDVESAGCFQGNLFHGTVDPLKHVPGAGIRPNIFGVPPNEGTHTHTHKCTPDDSGARKDVLRFRFP